MNYIPKIISGVLALALLGIGAWLVVAGKGDTGAALLTAGMAAAGAVGTVALPAVVGPHAGKGGQS